MRIVYLVSSPEGIGGAEKVLLELASYGRTRGDTQLILNPYQSGAEGNPFAVSATKNAEYLGLVAPRSRLLKARRWTAAQVKNFHPDVVVSFLPLAIATAGTLKKRSTLLVASHQHGDHLKVTGQRFKEYLDRWAGQRHDLVVACSDAVRDYLIEDYGYENSKVKTIRNGWSGHPLPHRGGERPTIVCVANFRPQKRHALLIEAFSEVRAAIHDAQLVLVGGGPLKGDVHHLCARLGMLDSVRFVGRVAQVWPHLATADVGVLASSYEPLGIAILEYMAAGLPVVATKVGGIPELVRHERNGYQIPPDDSRALAQALTTLLRDANLRDSMGDAAAKDAHGFTASNMAESYFRLFEERIKANPTEISKK